MLERDPAQGRERLAPSGQTNGHSKMFGITQPSCI